MSLQACTAGDTATFVRAWLREPLRVGAILPSGRGLAALITAGISRETGPVIELGPGTGTFTRALLRRGVREEDLALVEAGADFVPALRSGFPKARTLHLDAARLGPVRLFDGRPAGVVISGLPLLAMPVRRIARILAAAFAQLAPDGAFHQFTYGWRCPVPPAVLGRLGLEAERMGTTLVNLPPATVYRLFRA